MNNKNSDNNAERSRLTPSLVAELRQGDENATVLLDKFWREPLQRFCFSYMRTEVEAEDAVQEIFEKVIKSDLIPDDFRAWIYQVARNHCLNLIRGRGRRKDTGEMPERSIAADNIKSPLSKFGHDEVLGRLEEVLEELPEAYSEVLRMRYIEGLSRGQVADVLGIAESLVKSRLFEAMKMMRKHESLMESLT